MESNTGYIFLIVLALFVIVLITYFIKTMNRLTQLRNKVSELDSDMDVALTKRFDLLTKQYQAVKMYCAHESTTLIETIKMRRGMTTGEKKKISGKLDELGAQLRVTMEAYPQLRASENVAMLQKSCDESEAHLQAARRLYNVSVTKYNNACMEFPASVIAALTGNKGAEYFKADENKCQDVEFK